MGSSLKKFFQKDGGCRFCEDPEFALRHMREDELLNAIASLAADAVNSYGTSRQVTNYGSIIKELRELLIEFKNLDDEMAQLKRAERSLKVIEEELATD